MRTRALIPFVAVLFAAFVFAAQSRAQSPLITIDTVTVGDAGNAADTTGYGAVAYEFSMGKYEVTIGQYATFLNGVASVATENYLTSLWNPDMAGQIWSLGSTGIERMGSGTLADPYVYSPSGPFGLTPPGASSPTGRPAAFVSWFDAARFANWLHNGAVSGASTETGAYTLNGATSGAQPAKNPGATWWIPSQDEWYKAAYYKGGGTAVGYWQYPTQSDDQPGNVIGAASNQANFYASDFTVTQSGGSSQLQNYLTDVGAFTGSAGPYGTFDQGGNVMEWTDSSLNSSSILRGGSWYTGDALNSSITYYYYPETEYNYIGFRLATVPEPSTYALLAMSAAGALWWARRRR
jgi:formylglycine-generating enzyme required for sulfatase activity